MEELKMIVDLASKVTDQAYWLIILYFIKSISVYILGWVGCTTLVVLLLKFFKKLVNIFTFSSRINNLLGNPISNFDPFYTPNVDKLINYIVELKNKKN